MRLRIYLLLFVLIGFGLAGAYPGTSVFRVLACRGQVTANGNGLRVGSRLATTQSLQVPEGAYLCLMHQSGRALEVTAGAYAIKDLEARLTGRSVSLANRYAQFMVNELTNPTASNDIARSRASYMRKTGAVVRDFGSFSLLVALPLKTSLYGQQVPLRWASRPQKARRYKVVVSDLAEVVLHTDTVAVPEVLVNVGQGALAGKSPLIFKVVPLDDQGLAVMPETNLEYTNVVERLSPEKAAGIRAELDSLRPADEPPSALLCMIEASFFEEKGLLADAHHAYARAVALSGGAEAYRELYAAFLARGDWQKTGR
jgi:hypothetical protein